MKKHLVRIILGLLCVFFVLGHASRNWQVPFISALDAYLYDARVRTFMPDTVDDRVVVVDIDEKSLGELGRWPWGRNVVADLVRTMTDHYQVAVVGFDVVFAEPDESSGLKVLEQIGKKELRGEAGYQRTLRNLRDSLDYDRLLADTLRGRPVVMGYYFSNTVDAQQGGGLPKPVFTAGTFGDRRMSILSWEGFGANLIELQEAAASGGHFNPVIDFDGVVRRVPLFVEYKGDYYESLSLAVIRLLLGDGQLFPGFPDDHGDIEWIDVIGNEGGLRIPVDQNAASLVPYRGGERSFPYFSAVDVLQKKIPPEQMAGRIVLVGTSAPGLMDLRSTPVGGTYPGVEIHANLVAGMISGTIKAKPGYMMAVEVVTLAVFGGMLALLLPLLSPLKATLLTFVTLALTLGINLWLWDGFGLVLPLASGLLVILLLYALNMSWGYFIESRAKRQFTELFGQYVPPELVDEMARDPEAYSMEGRNEELTILFSDIRSFTSISEGMSPRDLTQMMNEYLGAMTEVIQTQRGTLDKYIGDAIMAFWGAPVSDPENARHAVLTALAMQKALRNLDEPFAQRGWPKLHIGVGLNTGVVTVGDMGSTVRKAYTVMGDAVNLASRLEGITKVYGVGIVVGESTRDKLPDFAFRELDRVRVKGKEKPVVIYEPLGPLSELSPETQAELAAWDAFLENYRAQAWDLADAQLAALPDTPETAGLRALYAGRIAVLRLSPPGENWDGVTAFETK